MNKYLTVLGFGVFVCLTLASTRHDPYQSRSFQIKVHNINQVEMCISNYGKFGQSQSGSCGLWWPTGSGHNYIYGAGFWFGTVDSATGDTLVTEGYDPHSGVSELAPGLQGWSPNDTQAVIFMYPDNWSQIDYQRLPMAPVFPVSHQDSWCCFNDCDSTWHVPGDTRPIGIEVYQTVYVWNAPIIEDVAFITYDIKNVSGLNFHNCYVGICTDCEIGNESGVNANDRLSGIIGKWYCVNGESLWIDNLGYQWQEQPEAGWMEFPGVIGFDLLQMPFDLIPGMDKDCDSIPDEYERDSMFYVNNLPPYKWDVDLDSTPDWRDASENPQLNMTAFKRFTYSFQPQYDNQRYLVLAGYNYQTGQYEPYDTIPPDPDDQKFLMSSGPFNLGADSIVTIVFAIMLANWYNQYSWPDTALALVDCYAQFYYDMSWRLYDIEERTANKRTNNGFQIFPNPAKALSAVRFTLAQPGLVALKLYDATGQLVKIIDKRFRQPGAHNVSMNLNGLSAGTYFIVLQTPSLKEAQRLLIIK